VRALPARPSAIAGNDIAFIAKAIRNGPENRTFAAPVGVDGSVRTHDAARARNPTEGEEGSESMKRLRVHVVLVGALLLALGIGSYAVAGGGKKNIKADDLTGYQENPDVSSTGTGSFEATIDDDAQTITYTVSYSGLEGGAAFAGHIHFGKRAVNGGVSAFLCGGGDKPACPVSGTVEGVIDAADVIGPAGQGIAAGEFDELVAAIRAGHAYLNIHTPMWPGGEIRAQINDRADAE
jgi:CHRD domain